MIDLVYVQAYIACGSGISRIGYVMICFGLANTIAAGLASVVAKVMGRNKILIITLVLHGSLLIWMRQWVAVPNDYFAYCSMAAIWGLLDGTWLVIINCKFKVIITSQYKNKYNIFPCQSIVVYSILWDFVSWSRRSCIQ